MQKYICKNQQQRDIIPTWGMCGQKRAYFACDLSPHWTEKIYVIYMYMLVFIYELNC